MKRLMLALVFLLSTSLADAGPLKRLIPGGCPGGNCPTVEVPVTAEVAPPSPAQEKVPTVDEAAKQLRRWRELPKDQVKRLEKIVDAPAVAKALAGHYGPGSCGMLGCAVHEEQWVPDGVETQEQLDARTVPWGGGGFRTFRFFGRRR